MADAMDVDASQPRQFRLVKASGDAHVARLPPSLGAPAALAATPAAACVATAVTSSRCSL